MFIPAQFLSKKTKNKVQAMSAAMLFTISSIGCSLNGKSAMPTATQLPPTATQLPPTATQPPPTATQPPPTATQPPPTATQPPPTATAETVGLYRDGSYLGDAIRTDHWGNTQVKAIIEGGMLTNIEIVQYPASKSESARLSLGAFPKLISESITNQSANIDAVSRATDTSIAFMRSLETALQDAAEGNASTEK